MNTEHTSNQHEMLSALADGQLRGSAFAKAVDQVLHDEEAQATWHCYHLIGDVLRSGDLARCKGDSAFLARLQTRLQQEPGFARPVPLGEPAVVAFEPVALSAGTKVAANEAGFRWKMVAGLASMAAVAAIGWNLVSAPGLPQPGASQQLAQQAVQFPASPAAQPSPIVQVAIESPAPAILARPAPAPVVTTTTQPVTLASGEPQVMIRDRRLDELLAAHKQFGGTSALQMPAGFLRNATFEGPSR